VGIDHQHGLPTPGEQAGRSEPTGARADHDYVEVILG
jgi:hypothetical protein